MANLTLTAYNSKYGNSPFQDKKTMENGYLQSGIKMNQRIARQTHWGSKELKERNQYLTEQAIALWPYVTTSYEAPQKQYDEAALDDDVSFTGKTLAKYRFLGAEHEASTWSQMYIAVIKELHNMDKAYLNYLADADDSVDMAAHVRHATNGGSAYVEIEEGLHILTGTSTQSKITLLRKLFEHYRQDPSDLVFFMEDAKETNHDGEATRYQLRRKYWEKALAPIQAATGTFRNVHATKNNAIYGLTKKPGVLLGCVANFDSARVELYVDLGDNDGTKAFFKKLGQNRPAIEASYGKALTWVNQKETRGCKIYDELQGVSIKNESDWESMIRFHAEMACNLLNAVALYL